jgi:hypothetical protein
MPQLTGVDDSLSVGYLRRAAYVGRTHGDLPIPLLGNRSISHRSSVCVSVQSSQAELGSRRSKLEGEKPAGDGALRIQGS